EGVGEAQEAQRQAEGGSEVLIHRFFLLSLWVLPLLVVPPCHASTLTCTRQHRLQIHVPLWGANVMPLVPGLSGRLWRREGRWRLERCATPYHWVGTGRVA